MGQYYIATKDGTYYELDSTISVGRDSGGTTTDYPLEDGSVVSDHYINQNDKITFKGTISTIKSVSTYEQVDASGKRRFKAPEEYIKGLDLIKKNKETFTVYFDNNIAPLDNCVFENLSISQSQTRGTSNAAKSFDVSFTAKQIKFVSRAQTGVVTDAEIKDLSEKKTQGSGLSVDYSKESKTTEQAAKESIQKGLGMVLGE